MAVANLFSNPLSAVAVLFRLVNSCKMVLLVNNVMNISVVN